MITTELADDVLDRLVDMPRDDQRKALVQASIIMDNWTDISNLLICRGIVKEYYEICAILRDI